MTHEPSPISPDPAERTDADPRGVTSEASARAALDGTFRGPFANLRRRIYLTYHYLGWRTVLWRVLTFPLRFTPLRRRIMPRRGIESAWRKAQRWYREQGLPVT